MSDIPKSLELYNQELAELHFSNKFVVFLCGPTLRDLAHPKVIRHISNIGQFIESIRIYYSKWYAKLRFKALGKPGAMFLGTLLTKLN